MQRSLSPVRVLATASLVAVVLAACGSRGPLDDAAPVVPEAGAAETSPTTTEDATTPTPTPTADASADAEKEAGIIECGGCLFDKCSDGILSCVQDEACRTTFQCVITDCLSSGSPNPACFLKCAGNPAGALKIFTIFQCVTQTCGPDCGDLLSTILGGLGGLGGGGGGGTDAGMTDAGKKDGGNKLAPEITPEGERARRNMIGAFSRWPELLPRSE